MTPGQADGAEGDMGLPQAGMHEEPKKPQKKRLVIAADTFLPRRDGVVRFLTEIIPRLEEEFEITLICPEFDGPYEKYPHAVVHRFPTVKVLFGDIHFAGFNYFKVRRIIKEADIIFVQSIGPLGISSIIAAKKFNKPILAYIHSVDWELATKSIRHLKGLADVAARLIAKHLYNSCSQLMVPGEEIALKLKKNGIRTKNTVVALGVDIRKFYPAPDKGQAKTNIGLRQDTKVVGFVSRVSREKDPMTMYRAFRRLEKRFPDIRLLVVGKGIKQVEREFTSNRNIMLPGSVDDVLPYYHAMDVFVLPSLTETSSLATMEAMACGLPVVVTPVGIIKSYIDEKRNGMTFPLKNSLVLSLKVEMLLRDEALSQEIGRNARKTIVQRFDWENTASAIRKMLHQSLKP